MFRGDHEIHGVLPPPREKECDANLSQALKLMRKLEMWLQT